jgi:hypothetical protein
VRPFDVLSFGGLDFTNLDVPPRVPLEVPPLEALQRWADAQCDKCPNSQRAFGVTYQQGKWFVRTEEGPIQRRASGSDLAACVKKATE